MLISTKGRYALIVMMDLASNERGKFVPLRDIAQRHDLSQKYLEAIFKPLSNSGYVLGMRGKNGGYMLARKAKDITVLEILEIAEDGIEPVSSMDDNLEWLWTGLHKDIRNYLSTKTLAMLVDKERKNEHMMRAYS